MPALSSQATGNARDRLLDAASTLFYRDGITATGIDAIVKRAGVAKKSLYNHFASKRELVAVYLEARHAEWLALYDARLSDASTPRDRVMAVFLAYEDHAAYAYEHGFRGCGLLNAAAELPAGDPGRAVVRGHKEQVEALLAAHLSDLLGGQQRATALAHQLAFLLEGAMARAGLEGGSDCLYQARQMADELLAAL
ncbi:helix-turn-helix domain-containing protein [Halomonas sp. CUBES01]|uniref:Helix-turn-helix domain containing protein n=1 Tax=Vreelandella gomseomensis TaxID=370766 RepID=A0ABU1GDX0_9GAMM|nr:MULTISPECIES: TetR/AcrR family transcriptional regulator [Halomonas]MDR5875672.1 helix-turn-helix domain containing protein [Halomonas gomseomensis]MEC4767873.1 helix-turn-helix domain-containing protein [Halomonas sp. CUBES01]